MFLGLGYLAQDAATVGSVLEAVEDLVVLYRPREGYAWGLLEGQVLQVVDDLIQLPNILEGVLSGPC